MPTKDSPPVTTPAILKNNPLSIAARRVQVTTDQATELIKEAVSKNSRNTGRALEEA